MTAGNARSETEDRSGHDCRVSGDPETGHGYEQAGTEEYEFGLAEYPTTLDREATYIWPRFARGEHDLHALADSADDEDGKSDDNQKGQKKKIPDADASEDVDSGDMPLGFLARELPCTEKEWVAYVREDPGRLGTWYNKLLRRDLLFRRVKTVPGAKVEDGKALSAEKAGTLHGSGSTAPSNLYTYWTIDPFNRFTLWWRVFITVLDATYTALYLPISVAWHYDLRYFRWFNVLDFAGGLIYIIDLCLGFVLGFTVEHNLKRRVIMRPDLIARYYVLHNTFLTDFFSSMAIIAEIVSLAAPGGYGSKAVHCVLLLRLFRLVRVFNLTQWLIFIAMVGNYSKALMRFLGVGTLFMIVVIYAACVLINFLACIWYFTATIEGQENSWLTSVGSDHVSMADQATPRQWIASVYWTTTTILTVGFGDISAATPAEMLVATCIMLIGVIFFGVVIATSQAIIGQISRNAAHMATLRGKLQNVQMWTTRRSLSPALCSKIRTYYAEIWIDHNEMQNDRIFAELPAVLRASVAFEACNHILESSNMFGQLPREARTLVITRLQPKTVAAGHEVYKEGDESDAVWILQSGELLSIAADGVEMISAPAILGQLAVMAKEMPKAANRQETLRAIAHVSMWKLSMIDLEHISQQFPEMKRRLLQTFQGYLEAEKADNPGVAEEKDWKEAYERVCKREKEAEKEAKDLASKGGKNRELLVRRGQVLTERQAQQDLARRIGLRWRAKATGRGDPSGSDGGKGGNAADLLAQALGKHRQGAKARKTGLRERA